MSETTPIDAYEIVHVFVRLRKAGVQRQDFDPVHDRSGEHAAVQVPADSREPFENRDAIGGAFARQEPADELVKFTIERKCEEIIISYAWARGATREVGRIHVEVGEGNIVTFTFQAANE